jgi:hypothetical protein
MLPKFVTFSGVDPTVSAADMAFLQKDFPKVEFGFLLSEKRQGQDPRYPAFDWLLSRSAEFWAEFNCSAHLCGSAIFRRFLERDRWFLSFLRHSFRRVQVNFNYLDEPFDHELFNQAAAQLPNLQIITQYNKANNQVSKHFDFLNHALLFDESGGNGVEAGLFWPTIPNKFCGYAGGLGPDNIAQQLVKISHAAGNDEYWIDMETGVRTDDKFDINKCHSVLQTIYSKETNQK